MTKTNGIVNVAKIVLKLQKLNNSMSEIGRAREEERERDRKSKSKRKR